MSLRLELADLQIAARGEVGAAGAPVGGHLREAAQLVRAEDAAGNAQAQHEGVLRGSDVEETVELEAEEIVGRGSLVFVGVRDELVPDVERVLLVLPALFFAEVGDRSAEPGRLRLFSGLIGERRRRDRW